jgi:hypothetical protein|eukprot:2933268-Prymnesium_polylepis.1
MGLSHATIAERGCVATSRADIARANIDAVLAQFSVADSGFCSPDIVRSHMCVAGFTHPVGSRLVYVLVRSPHCWHVQTQCFNQCLYIHTLRLAPVCGMVLCYDTHQTRAQWEAAFLLTCFAVAYD